MNANDVYTELGKEVSISEIERELRNLWEQDEARTNASLMNLVVYTEKNEGLLENSRYVSDLTRENACRTILVEINRKEEASLRAWIHAHCHLSHGSKSVCCEQISFRLTGRVTGRFRNTVFAHLNSDLPLFFWWQGELSDVFTERLASVMDRLIIDSSSWTEQSSSFKRILEIMELHPRLVIQDLAWTRCWQFRVGIASLFDDAVAQQMLPEMDRIHIKHSSKDRNTALQMLSWIVVQAGWKKIEPGVFETKEGRKITAEVAICDNSSPMSLVELSSKQGCVRVSREEGSTHLYREIHCGDYHESSLSPADPEKAHELVACQLSRGGKNSLFLKILPLFLEMV